MLRGREIDKERQRGEGGGVHKGRKENTDACTTTVDARYFGRLCGKVEKE